MRRRVVAPLALLWQGTQLCEAGRGTRRERLRLRGKLLCLRRRGQRLENDARIGGCIGGACLRRPRHPLHLLAQPPYRLAVDATRSQC